MTSAAENLAGHAAGAAEKEKVEKRRALGRGLESLLPGPRVVRPVAVPPTDPGAPADGGHAPGRPQVPSRLAPVRNDNAASSGTAVTAAGHASPSAQTIASALPAEGVSTAHIVINIELDRIDKNPYQTRYSFDKELLEELADSIKSTGVVQPVVVRPTENGRYALILGERRCRASKLAGMSTIPAIVKRVSNQQAAEMTVVENLQREDLNCLEQAEAFRLLSREFNLTQQQIGERVGMSRESVSNYMRLLKLPPRVLEYLSKNQLGFSEARALLTLEDPEMIVKAADQVVKQHMSVEQIEHLIMVMQGFATAAGQTDKAIGGSRWVDPNVRAAQLELERLLGVRVRIKDRKGKGKIVIEYATVDDYERVVTALSRR
jgi:ParB family transcriptional regulator, chromosome partitioning protein